MSPALGCWVWPCDLLRPMKCSPWYESRSFKCAWFLIWLDPAMPVMCHEESVPRVEQTWTKPIVWTQARAEPPAEPSLHQVACRQPAGGTPSGRINACFCQSWVCYCSVLAAITNTWQAVFLLINIETFIHSIMNKQKIEKERYKVIIPVDFAAWPRLWILTCLFTRCFIGGIGYWSNWQVNSGSKSEVDYVRIKSRRVTKGTLSSWHCSCPSPLLLPCLLPLFFHLHLKVCFPGNLP